MAISNKNPAVYCFANKPASQFTVGANTDITFTPVTGNIPNLGGQFTLETGTYRIQADFNCSTFSLATAGFIIINCVDSTTNAVIAGTLPATIIPVTYTSTETSNPSLTGIITVSNLLSPITVKFRVTQANGTATIVGTRCGVSINKIQ